MRRLTSARNAYNNINPFARLPGESQTQETCKTLGNELKMQIFAKAQKCKANNINMKIQKQQLQSKLGNLINCAILYGCVIIAKQLPATFAGSTYLAGEEL